MMNSPTAISTLLSSSESHAFHSFFTSIGDHADWSLAPPEIPKDRQALAKATKDLMALDHSYYPLPLDQPSYPHNYTLPPPPLSDSSSRTPTPTSADPYPTPAPHQPTRQRPTHPHPYPSSQRRSTSYSHPPPSANFAPAPAPPPPPRIKPPQPQPKPALLSPSQKKANHIQSEQKRRANIRRGYEALCECVPALREAIRLEEEAGTGGDPSRSGLLPGKCKKSRSGVKSARDAEDKVDGRAGPRSENVVLSKTIDYVTDLLEERRSLLERLHRARSTLPPGHPALEPPLNPHSQANDEGPLWEREWKGGQGSADGEGDESS